MNEQQSAIPRGEQTTSLARYYPLALAGLRLVVWPSLKYPARAWRSAAFRQRCIAVSAALAVAMAASGCRQAAPPEFSSSGQVVELSPEQQALVKAALVQHAGTPANPKMVGQPDFNARRLKQGAKVYALRCVQCHGESGDGNGLAAKHLQPRPRDYRRGIFKFTSTAYGGRPRREDLVRTIRRGVVGTSMPSFALMPQEELEPLVDYVLALTHRGELEVLLASEAEGADELPDELVNDLVAAIVEQWNVAESQTILPASVQPELSAATIEAGRLAFLSKGCSKCHGDDGRGKTRDNVGADAWGFTTSAADLTSGMLHGGTQPLDIYRRIYGGINGTPMPAFKDALATEPDTMWNLVHYVLHVSQGRRRGEAVYSPPELPPETPSSGSGAGGN